MDRQVGFHLEYRAPAPAEGGGRYGEGDLGVATHGGTCELRREKGNPLHPSTAQAGARVRAPRPAPPRPGPVQGPSFATPALAQPRGRVGAEAGTAPVGLTSPPFRAEVRVHCSPAPALPSGPGPTGRSRRLRSGPGHGGHGKVTGGRRPGPGKETSALPLASQSAQYLLSSSLSSLDRMSWCCSFSFWAFSRQERVAISAAGQGARNSYGGGGGGRRQEPGWRNAPGAAGTASGLTPGSGRWNRSCSGGGGGSSADVSRLLAGPPRTHRPSRRGRRREEGTGRDFRVARQEGTQTPVALRMRRTSREAGQALSARWSQKCGDLLCPLWASPGLRCACPGGPRVKPRREDILQRDHFHLLS